jgi:hypothetical protein
MDIGPTAVQEQAEFHAVTAGRPGLVAVGSFGGPDDVIPVVWLSPARSLAAYSRLE